MNSKKLLNKESVREEHWVGDGFYVSSIFQVSGSNVELISPFLLMDHAAPREFSPSLKPRGVGEHPHRGFETVTLAYAGEIEHRDSGGGGGKISSGGVQWMTAASGVVHEELHSESFSRTGGKFEMVQLWVNLPRKMKMSKPRYQGLDDKDFPRLSPATGVSGRLIAGDYDGVTGPALTHSEIRIMDFKFETTSSLTLKLPEGTNTLVFVRSGQVSTDNSNTLGNRELGMFSQAGNSIPLHGQAGSEILVLNGRPLGEPVATYGPFVMNTRDEILQAVNDYESGKMGRLPPRNKASATN